VLSNGPKPKMPNLVNQNCQAAVTLLQQIQGMDLQVSTPGVPDPLRQILHVTAQDVPPDTQLTQGQSIQLTCSP
jgi:hypothetical protein